MNPRIPDLFLRQADFLKQDYKKNRVLLIGNVFSELKVIDR